MPEQAHLFPVVMRHLHNGVFCNRSVRKLGKCLRMMVNDNVGIMGYTMGRIMAGFTPNDLEVGVGLHHLVCLPLANGCSLLALCVPVGLQAELNSWLEHLAAVWLAAAGSIHKKMPADILWAHFDFPKACFHTMSGMDLSSLFGTV